MRHAAGVMGASLAAAAVLAGCAGGSVATDATRGTVTGVLLGEGGPPGAHPATLPGTVVAASQTGQRFTAAAGGQGRFRLLLPPGTYRLTGHSPQIDNGMLLCLGAGVVHVTSRITRSGVTVICSIR